MTQLDLKSQLAANHVAKQRMLELYADYGADVVEAVSEELIRQSEQLVRNRLSELPDGEWRVREYIDMPGANAKVELTAIKEGDTLTYDFTGSSPQARARRQLLLLGDLGRPVRADLPAARLGRDLERGRDAADRADRARGDDRQLHPPGADLDRHGRARSRSSTTSRRSCSRRCSARASGMPHRATAVWHGSHAHVETHGFTADGEFFVAPLTDTFCGAGRRACVRGRRRPRRRDPQHRLPLGERREPGAEHADSLPLPPGGARLRRPGQVPRRRLPRVRLRPARDERADGRSCSSARARARR